jgi:hypothetical protein
MMDDQRTVIYVAAGVATGAFLGAHLKGMNWCPMMWGSGIGSGCPFAIFGGGGGGKKKGGACGTGGGGGGGGGGAVATKEEFISRLGMIPHPEGGFFVETYRSGSAPMTSKGQTDQAGTVMVTSPPRAPTPARNVMTSIYYMLTAESGGQQWWGL